MTIDPRDTSLIPATIKEAIDAWKNGCRKGEPGSFVLALLENNLQGAVSKADPTNLTLLPNIVFYMMWNLPGEIYGTPEKVQMWLKYNLRRAHDA